MMGVLYNQVVGDPKHGRVLGYGAGKKPSNLYKSQSRQSCNDKCREDRERENEEFKAKVREEIKAEVREEVKAEVQAQIPSLVADVLRSMGISSTQYLQPSIEVLDYSMFNICKFFLRDLLILPLSYLL